MSQKKAKQSRRVDRVLSLMPEAEKRQWRITFQRFGKTQATISAFEKRLDQLKALDRKLRGKN